MKIIPGEKVAEHVAQIGSHAGSAVASREQRKADEAASARLVAQQSPEAWATGEREKSKRYFVRAAGIGVLVLAGLGIGGYTVNNIVNTPKEVATAIGDGLGEVAEAIKPRELTIADVQTALESLQWDESEGLIEGKVSGQGHLHTERHILFFNQPGGQSETYSNRFGNLKLSALDVSFYPVELGANDFQAHAIVDPKSLVVELSGAESGPYSPAYNGIVRSIVGGVRGTNDSIRQQVLNDLTDKVMEQKCIANFEPVVEASIKHRVRQELESQLTVLRALNDEIAVRAYESMLANPIIVETSDGTPIDEIDLSALARSIDGIESIASQIDSDPEYTALAFEKDGSSTIDCSVSENAAKQMIALAQAEEKEALSTQNTTSLGLQGQ